MAHTLTYNVKLWPPAPGFLVGRNCLALVLGFSTDIANVGHYVAIGVQFWPPMPVFEQAYMTDSDADNLRQ